MKITICDWLKKPIKPGEKTFSIKIEESDHEFELCKEAWDAILERLTASELPSEPQIKSAPQEPAQPPQEAPQSPAIGMLDVETSGDPFDAGPSSMPETPQAVAQETPVYKPPAIEIPDDPKKKLGTPSKEVWEQVMAEAKQREPGTLDTLGPGEARRRAGKLLSELDEKRNQELRRMAGSDINFTDKPRG